MSEKLYDLHFLKGEKKRRQPLPPLPPKGCLMAVGYTDPPKRFVSIGGKWVESRVPSEREK